MTRFSVIIPSRNRPSLLRVALASVAAQSCDSVEIIVVDDGSDEGHLSEYRAIVGHAGKPVSFHSLPQRPLGHGPGYTRNFAAARATGDYLCFLDDDDSWTDPSYLDRVGAGLEANPQSELHLSNQAAFSGDAQLPGPIWIEELEDILKKAGSPSRRGIHIVTTDQLLACKGFAHLNTLVVRRSAFDAVHGFDEELRWEEDRDLYLRLIDACEMILYSPRFVSRHNVPNPAERSNASTAMSDMERRLSQLRVFEKAYSLSRHREIRAYGAQQKAYTLKHLAESLVRRREYERAIYYARAAWEIAPTPGWTVYTAWIAFMAGSTRGRPIEVSH
jgi:glycosyltransferase involved in cell wall biosynthesis